MMRAGLDRSIRNICIGICCVVLFVFIMHARSHREDLNNELQQRSLVEWFEECAKVSSITINGAEFVCIKMETDIN